MFSRCVSGEAFDGPIGGNVSNADLELSGYVTRLQRQMLALIPHFDLGPDMLALVKRTMPERQQQEALR